MNKVGYTVHNFGMDIANLLNCSVYNTHWKQSPSLLLHFSIHRSSALSPYSLFSHLPSLFFSISLYLAPSFLFPVYLPPSFSLPPLLSPSLSVPPSIELFCGASRSRFVGSTHISRQEKTEGHGMTSRLGRTESIRPSV